MTRMSREFSLVLLGSGILTAGYFLAPSPEADLEQKANELAAERVGGGTRDSNGTYRYHPGYMLFFMHSSGYTGGAAGGRSAAVSGPVSRGGFGGVGRSAAGS